MQAKDAIRTSIETADMITKMYLEDMSDQELMHRPHPNCNHIKWQLGHLISSDHQMIEGCCPGTMPELPEGFAEQYSKETASSDELDAFHSKADLMSLFGQHRQAAMDRLTKLTDEELDAESPEAIRSYAPTFGAAFGMVGIHWTMHTGQWAVIRRQLGREPLM